MEKKDKKHNGGIVALIICIVLTIAIIVGCLFFKDEIFSILK